MRVLTTVTAVAVCAGAGYAQTIDFEGFVHGQIITTQLAPLVTISATNPNRAFDIAAIFDTTMTGTSDPDLEGPPWAGGNLAADQVVLGNAIIIAENNTGAGDGILDDPDDEGSRPSGDLIFEFRAKIDRFGFDVIDIEGQMIEGSSVEFFNDGMSVGLVQFADFIDNTSVFYNATVAFGDNYANRINPITVGALVDAGFDDAEAGFDTVVIHVGGSSAYDNIVIPAPGSLALMGLGGLAAARRRNRA